MTKPLTHTGLALLFLGTFCATTSVARAEEQVRWDLRPRRGKQTTEKGADLS